MIEQDRDEIINEIAEAERRKAAAYARLMAPAAPAAVTEEDDRISVADAAELIGMSKSWVRSNLTKLDAEQPGPQKFTVSRAACLRYRESRKVLD